MENALTNVDYNEICRICLQTAKNATSLFSEQQDSKEVLEKIYFCFQIVLKHSPHVPSLICNGCIEELNIANNFRQKCVKTEERFAAYTVTITQVKPIKCEDESGVRDMDDYYVQSDLLEELNESVGSTKHGNHGKFFESDDRNSGKSYKNDENKTLDKTNTKNDELGSTCKICGKVLASKRSLVKHNISMHQKRKHVGKVTGSGINRRYHCTECSYSTPHSQTLVNHIRRHNGDRPYQCKCGKSFTQAASLTTHQKTHSTSTYFTCETCGKQFKRACSLKNHSRVHETQGIYSCDICLKSLKSQQALREHIYRHKNIRNYSCEDCGATFVSCSELLNHRKKHMDHTVECHICGYKTYAKKNLEIHIKRHAGKKSFKCDLCPTKVYTRSDLRRHERVHTREKPYPCPTCAQRFSVSTSLNKHMRNVHNIQFKWGDSKGKDMKSDYYTIIYYTSFKS